MARPVRILLFAAAREAVGRGALERNVPPSGLRVGPVLDELRHQYPRLTKVLRASRVVLNGAFVDDLSSELHEGDELAVHPPYSGG